MLDHESQEYKDLSDAYEIGRKYGFQAAYAAVWPVFGDKIDVHPDGCDGTVEDAMDQVHAFQHRILDHLDDTDAAIEELKARFPEGATRWLTKAVTYGVVKAAHDWIDVNHPHMLPGELKDPPTVDDIKPAGLSATLSELFENSGDVEVGVIKVSGKGIEGLEQLLNNLKAITDKLEGRAKAKADAKEAEAPLPEVFQDPDIVKYLEGLKGEQDG